MTNSETQEIRSTFIQQVKGSLKAVYLLVHHCPDQVRAITPVTESAQVPLNEIDELEDDS